MNTQHVSASAEGASVEALIVTFNSDDSIESCLKALAAAGAGLRLGITVVDNCSAKDITPAVRRTGIPVDIVRLDENRGYARGNNVGIQRILQKSPLLDAI